MWMLDGECGRWMVNVGVIVFLLVRIYDCAGWPW